jgi:tRNA dimethylallyltransferase|tara:strand:- start:373 stop:1302 length:930 start_codon:yes stop_codon:yes gene_type:complete
MRTNDDSKIPNSKHLIVIVGPTAIGKTSLSIALAKHYSCAVLSADSRQFYKEMEIGTAKPTAIEMDGVPHHFINNLSIHDRYTAGMFEIDAIKLLDTLYRENDVAILVGGSGLFVDAICNGFDDVPGSQKIREELIKELDTIGIEPLQQELKEKDPEYYNTSDIQNSRRVLRALEVLRVSGNTFSSYRNKTAKNRPFNIHLIGLNTDRSVLYDRINLRVDLMVKAGLLEEVKRLLPHRYLSPLNTVGYKELYDNLGDQHSIDTAISKIKQNSRKFAKRQVTWFRRNEKTKWFDINSNQEILEYLQKKLK